jgi:hypothetical protein
MKKYFLKEHQDKEVNAVIGSNTLKEQIDQIESNGFEVVGFSYDGTFNLYFHIIKKSEEKDFEESK